MLAFQHCLLQLYQLHKRRPTFCIHFKSDMKYIKTLEKYDTDAVRGKNERLTLRNCNLLQTKLSCHSNIENVEKNESKKTNNKS